MEPVSTRGRLRVAPGAARSGVVGRHADAREVRIATWPKRRRANDALVRLLTEASSITLDGVRPVSGHGGRDKIVELVALDLSQIERRMSFAAEEECDA
jgi:uncharacterized protein